MRIVLAPRKWLKPFSHRWQIPNPLEHHLQKHVMVVLCKTNIFIMGPFATASVIKVTDNCLHFIKHNVVKSFV